MVKDECEDNKNDCKNYEDFITPNLYIGFKPRKSFQSRVV